MKGRADMNNGEQGKLDNWRRDQKDLLSNGLVGASQVCIVNAIWNNCEYSEKLIERIRESGIANIEIKDFKYPLVSFRPGYCREIIDDFTDVLTSRYTFAPFFDALDVLCKKAITISTTICDVSNNSQEARLLSAAINRLVDEVYNAFQRAYYNIESGTGKTRCEDILSCTRHGALWDRVENAIVSLSTEQAETSGEISAKVCAEVRAEIRGLKKKSNAKEIKWMQLERSAKWLKDARAAGVKNERGHDVTTRDAAQIFYKEISEEKSKGGYANTNSVLGRLNDKKNAVKLGIEECIKRRGQQKNKRKR